MISYRGVWIQALLSNIAIWIIKEYRAMKICPYCGTKNRDEESFCEHCGAFLDATVVTGTQEEDAHINDSQSLIPGTQLQYGRYIIKKILGQGGMGTLA